MASTDKQLSSKAEQVKEIMKGSICHFVYTKKDGSLREAFGTTNEENLPSKWAGFNHRLNEDVVSLDLKNESLALERIAQLKDNIAEMQAILAAPKTHDKKGEGYVNYYDLVKKTWGKFHEDSVVEIMRPESLK